MCCHHPNRREFIGLTTAGAALVPAVKVRSLEAVAAARDPQADVTVVYPSTGSGKTLRTPWSPAPTAPRRAAWKACATSPRAC